MGLSDKAQIGIYPSNNTDDAPIVVITRHGFGHPTGSNGVVPELAEIVPEIVHGQGNSWNAARLAAKLIHYLVARGFENQYSIDETLDVETRFYYAVMPTGVTVYDARGMTSIADVADKTKSLESEMFHTVWIEPERMRKLEAEMRKLEDELSAKRLEFEGMKRKQPK
jgi:hypothetical protein